MQKTSPYVRLDEHGVYRVGNTQVMLDGIVYGHLTGVTPESMQEQFPSLALEEVYGAIAFFLGNRDEVNEYLARQQQIWDFWKAKSEENPSPVLQRLRSMRHAETRDKP